jgi:hypothetical protein
MSKLINEDWEHASRFTDEMFDIERQYIMEIEWQEWEYEESKKSKKPAIIKVEKNKKTNETSHKPSNI